MQKIKIVEGFIFAIIENEKAKELIGGIYRLHQDDTESLIENENDLNNTITSGDLIGIEIGHEITFVNDFLEKESISFIEFMDQKIKAIIKK